jgi:hypothetical protein
MDSELMEADADGCTVLDDSFLMRLALCDAFDDVADLPPPPFLFFSFSAAFPPPSSDLKKSLMLLCLSISR